MWCNWKPLESAKPGLAIIGSYEISDIFKSAQVVLPVNMLITMKKILILFLLMPTLLRGQTALPVNSLQVIPEKIKVEYLFSSLTALSMGLSDPETHHVKVMDPIIDLYLLDHAATKDPADKQAYALIKKNKELIKNYYAEISGFGDTDPYLYFKKESDLPFSFNLFNGLVTFTQSKIFYDSSVNTLKLDADQRANLVAKNMLLPSLYNLKPLLASSDIKYFCIIGGYLAKDFSSDSIANKDGEVVAIVIPKSVLTKYINADITDDDVFKLATFYNVNKNGANLRKVILK